jgi:hypothetical protein
MVDSTAGWVTHAQEVLSQSLRSHEIVPFAISFLTAIYGPKSPQLKAYNDTLAQIAKSADGVTSVTFFQKQHAYGVVKNTVAEIQSGLITSVRAEVAGEVFGELVGLGKQILEENSDPAKNVSAVLIAAAFEDLIRRMGSELAGVVGRPKLEDVITSLKDANILRGGEVSTALSYLKFRNDSLHADWDNVQRPQIQSCIGFVEGLLAKHFS